MGCNKSNISNCGCGTNPSVTIEDYEGFKECEKEPCSEIFSDECIMHIQEKMSVSNGTKTLSFEVGDKLSDIIQKIMIISMNSNINPDHIPTGLRVEKIGETSIIISWKTIDNKSYSIKYKKSTETTYTEVNVESDTYELSNLSKSTLYNIYVRNKTNEVDSVVLTVKTI